MWTTANPERSETCRIGVMSTAAAFKTTCCSPQIMIKTIINPAACALTGFRETINDHLFMKKSISQPAFAHELTSVCREDAVEFSRPMLY